MSFAGQAKIGPSLWMDLRLSITVNVASIWPNMAQPQSVEFDVRMPCALWSVVTVAPVSPNPHLRCGRMRKATWIKRISGDWGRPAAIRNHQRSPETTSQGVTPHGLFQCGEPCWLPIFCRFFPCKSLWLGNLQEPKASMFCPSLWLKRSFVLSDALCGAVRLAVSGQ